MTNVASKFQTWDVVNQGSGSWGGVSGTSWVASGKRLYSRYELDQSTPVDAVLVIKSKPTVGSAATVVQTSELSGWAANWNY
ncbi:MAG TPA: hypothetical protein VGH27_24615 [Streptosporangiaceae bacterium]